MKEVGYGVDLEKIKNTYFDMIKEVMNESNLMIPDTPARHANGKTGIHSEHLGYILADFQYIQRAYPNMQW